MSKDILEKNITELFGFEEMTDDEKADLLESIGNTIMESTILRYLMTAEKNDAERFESYLAEHEEDSEPLEKLLVDFPEFGSLLEEEVVAFKKEALQVLAR